MKIHLIEKPISSETLNLFAKENYETMVKGVVDLEKKVLALGGELHADAESYLLERGSAQADLWGFNLHIDKEKDQRIEYSSFINIRPGQGNRSLMVESPELRDEIRAVIDGLVA